MTGLEAGCISDSSPYWTFHEQSCTRQGWKPRRNGSEVPSSKKQHASGKLVLCSLPFPTGCYRNARFSTVRGTWIKEEMELHKAALKISLVLQKKPTEFQNKSNLQRKNQLKQTPKKKPWSHANWVLENSERCRKKVRICTARNNSRLAEGWINILDDLFFCLWFKSKAATTFTN